MARLFVTESTFTFDATFARSAKMRARSARAATSRFESAAASGRFGPGAFVLDAAFLVVLVVLLVLAATAEEKAEFRTETDRASTSQQTRYVGLLTINGTSPPGESGGGNVRPGRGSNRTSVPDDLCSMATSRCANRTYRVTKR